MHALYRYVQFEFILFCFVSFDCYSWSEVNKRTGIDFCVLLLEVEMLSIELCPKAQMAVRLLRSFNCDKSFGGKYVYNFYILIDRFNWRKVIVSRIYIHSDLKDRYVNFVFETTQTKNNIKYHFGRLDFWWGLGKLGMYDEVSESPFSLCFAVRLSAPIYLSSKCFVI